MLRLKLSTEPRWAYLAENNIKEALIDHAFCEQKAASSAISLIVNFPEYPEIVTKMSEIAQEEMDHFSQVHEKILSRGWTLGKERKDPYVGDLWLYFRGKGKGRRTILIDRLLFSAMIEARSCERFRLLYKTVKDQELKNFYHKLEQSEAEHYSLFIALARKYAPDDYDVEKTWQGFLEYESKVVAKYGKTEHIHG
ncbi:MAG: tRNA-(ms[2]io[6]A)-hydroxylase [Candidatus Kapaibacteriales bacterium]